VLEFSAVVCLIEEVSSAYVSVVRFVIENTIVPTSYPSFLIQIWDKKKNGFYYAQYKKLYY